MAERSYVTVLWELSPRLVEVAAPAISGGGGGSDEILIQDLHDTLKSNTLQAGEADDSLNNLDDDPLIDSEGKADLGGGLSVGITARLLDGQIAFEANYTPEQSGTATSADVAGTSLTDTSALFITTGVTRGAVIVNFTDQSIAEVLQVNSETQLDHRVLVQGIADDWTSGDVYKIWNVVQKEVGGGNILAEDALGADLSPIFPTAFTQVVRTLAVSAALVDGDITDQIVEGNITVQGALRAILAAVGGRSDGFSDIVGDIVAHYRDQANTKDRITVTVDEFGNRKSVTFDLSD